MTHAQHKPAGMTLMKVLQIVVVVVLVVIAIALANLRFQSAEGNEPARGQPAATRDIRMPNSTLPRARQPRLVVVFRLDRDLTSGLYLGERWVSPPVFSFAQPGARYVVQAKLQQIDSQDERIDLSGDWAASDPEMVAITRGHGEVTLTVRKPGESRVTAATPIGAKVLQIKATQSADAMRVDISQ